MRKLNFTEIPDLEYSIYPAKMTTTSGDGHYTELVSSWFKEKYDIDYFLLTTSCTHALELAALLLNISPGDEVISPSFTFVSSVNPFVLRGAKIKFVDIDPLTMNINPEYIRDAINEKTKAIVVVHYGGVACDMDAIMSISNEFKIPVVEDAAQAINSKYKNKYLGTIGHLGALSFHHTKNYSMGEGGALIVNNESLFRRASILREKGTNRIDYVNGIVDKYSWVDLGSSYLPSDILASFLYTQLISSSELDSKRLALWNRYYENLLGMKEYFDIVEVPNYAKINGHIFFIKVEDELTRNKLHKFLMDKGVDSRSHYVPLHTSKAGLKYSDFVGEDIVTTRDSIRLLRLPLHVNLSLADIDYVSSIVIEFYGQ